MNTKITPTKKLSIYLLYIILSCLFTAVLNIIHTLYVLRIEFTATAFLIPLLAGALFGTMMAHIKILSAELSDIAYTDALTNIYNRLHFTKHLKTEIDKDKRYGSTFSIIFFDLDNFKAVNDNYGHQAGDRVLQQVTSIVSPANRNSDFFARYGGEEFIILTPETNLEGAMIHAERLRKDIDTFEFDTVGHISSSFGVSEFNREADSAGSLLRRADKALYLAKERGRNRVEKL